MQGGIDSLIVDESGLLLPPHPDAVKWLKDFWKTGSPRKGSSPHAKSNLENLSPQSIEAITPPPGICGMTSGQPEKKSVLVVPAGDSWKAEKWLDRPDMASFDIIAIYHGEGNFTCPLCTAVVRITGPKWRLYLDLSSGDQWDDIAKRYEYIMLPDDDLELSTCAINKVFDIMRTYDLLLAQPSVCEHGGSATWRPELHQRVQYLLRYCTFVEVMAPTYRMDFFHRVVRRTFSKYWTYVGWGLDSVWPALLRYPKDRIAVIDAVCMAHTPTEGGMGTSGKVNSVYRPGLSPYTAKQEELIVFSAYNYTSATVEALGESFMSSRIVGGVLNSEVAAAMGRTLGVDMPSSIDQNAKLSTPVVRSSEVYGADVSGWVLALGVVGAGVVAMLGRKWSLRRNGSNRKRGSSADLIVNGIGTKGEIVEARRWKDPSSEA